MDTLRQFLEILRDLGIVIGIPTLIAVWLRINRTRIDALQAQIKLLEQTQYSNALTQIQAQKALYEIELNQLHDRLRTIEEESADPQQKAAVEEDIRSIQENLAALQRFREDIADGIETEAVRKFEMVCKRLSDPSEAIPEHIFVSATYGDGVSHVGQSALQRKGVIEVRDGNVCLTKKGREIWQALRKAEESKMKLRGRTKG